MKRNKVLGVSAPPPKPTRLLCSVLILVGAALTVVLGLAMDPLLRWLIGAG